MQGAGLPLRHGEGMGHDLPAVRAEGGVERLRLPSGGSRCAVYPETKIAVSALNRKHKPLRGGRGTMHRNEGTGQELPAFRAAGGAIRLRLPAAVADALFYPKTEFAVRK